MSFFNSITYQDACVCCGAYVPEGRMVCVRCEREADQSEGMKRLKGWIREGDVVEKKSQGETTYLEMDLYEKVIKPVLEL